MSFIDDHSDAFVNPADIVKPVNENWCIKVDFAILQGVEIQRKIY